MKQIIVPIDFSQLSLPGLHLALVLARHLESGIEMVHVLKKEENIPDVDKKDRWNEVEQSFQKIVEEYSKTRPTIKIDYIIKEGKIYEEVASQAEAYKDSIIVTSTHGSSGWEEFFVGSNAYKIVTSSSRPVFSIRGNNIPAQIKKIVLPLDNTLETREKVPFTTKLAERLGSEVQVVTVSSSDFPDIQARMNDYAIQVCHYLTHHHIKNTLEHITGNNITDITIDYALDKKADLISIMTEQDKSIANLLLGSYAHQMINKSPLPVLLFPTKQVGIYTESFKTEGINY